VDWLTDFELPTAFYYSTIVIIGCSITFHLAKKAIQKTIKAPLLHFFCYFSIGDIVCDPAVYGLWSDSARWYYFTGSEITTTFLYVVTVVHLIHLAGGVISLLIIIYNHFKQNTIQVKLLNRTRCNVLALS
jgi:cytochrome c oxidase subunit 3